MFLKRGNILGSPKLRHPIRAAVGLMLQKTRRSEQFMITHNGYKIPFHADSNLALTLWSVPEFNDPAERFAEAWLKPGDMVIDIGANIGTFAATSSVRVGSNGCVHAFEAHPGTFKLLQRTMQVNDFTNVSCHQLAVSSSPETIRISDLGRKDDSNHIQVSDTRGIEVPATTLAGFIEKVQLTLIDLLKIDVEGHEPAVLAGLASHASKVSCIFVEVLPQTLSRYGSTVEDVTGWLRNSGFELFRLTGDRDNVVAFNRSLNLAPAGLQMQNLLEVFE